MQNRQAAGSAVSRLSRKTSVANADEIFSNKRSKVEYNGNSGDAPKYFKKRLSSQQSKRRNNSYFDGVVRRTNDNIADLSKQHAQAESHDHLNSFLRDQIVRKQGGAEDQNKERYSSAAPSSRRAQLDDDAVVAGNGTNLHNMVMVSGYQADPLAATLNQRSIGLSKLNVNKKQIDEDNMLMSRTLNVRGGIGIIHKTPQVTSQKAHNVEKRS